MIEFFKNIFRPAHYYEHRRALSFLGTIFMLFLLSVIFVLPFLLYLPQDSDPELDMQFNALYEYAPEDIAQPFVDRPIHGQVYTEIGPEQDSTGKEGTGVHYFPSPDRVPKIFNTEPRWIVFGDDNYTFYLGDAGSYAGAYPKGGPRTDSKRHFVEDLYQAAYDKEKFRNQLLFLGSAHFIFLVGFGLYSLVMASYMLTRARITANARWPFRNFTESWNVVLYSIAGSAFIPIIISIFYPARGVLFLVSIIASLALLRHSHKVTPERVRRY